MRAVLLDDSKGGELPPRQLFQPRIGASSSQGFILAFADGKPVPACLRNAPRERPCPAKAVSGKPAWFLSSLLFHASLIVAAVLALPQPAAPIAERGGIDQPLEVVVVGAQEALAQQEGAKSSAETSGIIEPTLEVEAAPSSTLVVAEDLAEPVPPEQLSTPAPEASAEAKPAEEIASLALAPPNFPPTLEPAEASPLTAVKAQETVIPPPATPSSAAPTSSARAARLKNEATKPPSPPLKQQLEKEQKRLRVPKPAAASPAGSTTAKGKAGQGDAQTSRAASAAGGTGGSAVTAGRDVITDYRARVVAHLTRYKTYPEQARDRGEIGRNAVKITLARDGSVTIAAIASPSGHPLLDAATLAAVRRAQPFPAIPESGPASFTLTIGLAYALR